MDVPITPGSAIDMSPLSAPAEGGATHREGYRPRPFSLPSLGLTLFVQSVPVVVALWAWQPALVQLAPQTALSVFDIPAQEAPAMKQTPPDPPEPAEPEQAPTTSPPALTPSPRTKPAPVPPAIAIPSAMQMPQRAASSAVAAAPSPPPPAPRASSQKPADWQSRVLGRLNAVKAYPASARARRQQGVVLIRFTLDRKGNLLTVALERSSGFALLDREAVALPKRASPLPPPPEDIGGERIELVVPVEFYS